MQNLIFDKERIHREKSVDIIKIVACVSVIALHFASYHYQSDTNVFSYLFAHAFRWFTFQCIGLFCMATGYLCCEKKITKRYFKNILPILLTYYIYCILVSLIIHPADSFYTVFSNTNYYFFKFPGYFWYMNYYIPFFLLIPFINLVIEKMERKSFFCLLCISILIVSLPGDLNVLHDFFPTITYNFALPNYFSQDLFPFVFYLIGAFIRKHQSKLKTGFSRIMILIAFIGSLFLHSLLDWTYLHINSAAFEPGQHVYTFNTYGNIFTIFSCWLFFLLITNFIKSDSRNPIILYISSHTLDIYLGLVISDRCLQQFSFPYSVWGLVTWVAGEFAITLLISILISIVKTGVIKGARFLKLKILVR